jgi:peptidyl-prolyl cis-trans isomerase C
MSCSASKKLFSEPLLQFLLIGAALFAVSRMVRPDSGRAESPRQIQITLDDFRQLEIAFVSQWHREPTPQEMAGLVEGHIRQEILYREALAMGLDKDDTIVERRMAQKMEFLAEDVAAAREPTTTELRAWFEKHSQNFALPSRATFRHLYFSFDSRHEHAGEDAARALEKLAGQREESPLASSLADRFMLQDYYGDRTPEQLAKEFGPNFAQALFQLKPGSWQGPIQSGYGWHLIWIDSIAPGREPSFEEIEPDVKSAWLADQKAESSRKAYEKMRARYEVVLPVPVTTQAHAFNGTR